MRYQCIFWDLLLALAFVQAIIRLTLIAVQRLKSISRGSPPQKAKGDLRRFSGLLLRVVICISLFILTKYRRIILLVQTYICYLLHLLHWSVPHPYWYLLEFLSKLSTFISLLTPPPPSWIKAALNFPNLYPRKYSLCRLISRSGISGEDDCMFQLCSYVDHANGPNRHLRQVIFAQKRFLFTFVKILRLIFVWNWGETYAPKNQIFIQVCLLIQTTHAEDED